MSNNRPDRAASDNTSLPSTSSATKKRFSKTSHVACTDACTVDPSRAQHWTLDDTARMLFALRDHLKDRITYALIYADSGR
jgi:hypothetical protein